MDVTAVGKKCITYNNIIGGKLANSVKGKL
jgi:hypothetical protein